MMNTIRKYLIGVAALGAAALAAVILIPGLAGETPSQSTSAVGIVGPAQAEEIHVNPADTAQPAPANPLPGGASSVRETYQDWLVACGQKEEATQCGMSQQQHNAQTRQRVLAIELHPSGEKLSGALVLPFGLSLDAGVTLQIDEGTPLPQMRFSTCLPAGCVVPLSFDAAAVQALTLGGTLKVNVVADGGKALPMSVSLEGFSVARQRIQVLAK